MAKPTYDELVEAFADCTKALKCALSRASMKTDDMFRSMNNIHATSCEWLSDAEHHDFNAKAKLRSQISVLAGLDFSTIPLTGQAAADRDSMLGQIDWAELEGILGC